MRARAMRCSMRRETRGRAHQSLTQLEYSEAFQSFIFSSRKFAARQIADVFFRDGVTETPIRHPSCRARARPVMWQIRRCQGLSQAITIVSLKVWIPLGAVGFYVVRERLIIWPGRPIFQWLPLGPPGGQRCITVFHPMQGQLGKMAVGSKTDTETGTLVDVNQDKNLRLALALSFGAMPRAIGLPGGA